MNIISRRKEIVRNLVLRYAFEYNVSFKSKKHMGYCDWQKKVIRIHPKCLEVLTLPELKQVVLHEIAHALTPQDKHHGEEFQRMALKLGVKKGNVSTWLYGISYWKRLRILSKRR